LDIYKSFLINDLSVMAGIIKSYFFEDSVNIKSDIGGKADILAVLCYSAF